MAKKTTSRKPDAMLPDVLMDWWEGKRPVGWTLEQHLENPTINCAGSIRDEKLAQYVGQHLNQRQKDGGNSH